MYIKKSIYFNPLYLIIIRMSNFIEPSRTVLLFLNKWMIKKDIKKKCL